MTASSSVSQSNVESAYSLRLYDLRQLSSHRNFGNGSDLMPYRRAGAHPSFSLGTTIARPIKKAIAANVIGQFNDRSRGDKPVVRRTDGLFDPRAVVALSCL